MPFRERQTLAAIGNIIIVFRSLIFDHQSKRLQSLNTGAYLKKFYISSMKKRKFHKNHTAPDDLKAFSVTITIAIIIIIILKIL